MTSIGMGSGVRTFDQAARREDTTVRLLLGCGILSSLLYIATDVLGGLAYPGYSFSSQAVSELGAIGAPSKPLVDTLFLGYDLLALFFGLGVFQAGAWRNRALRLAGAMLIAYGAVGTAVAVFGGPTLFAMHPRGGAVSDDALHILLTAVLVLFLLLSMGFGAFALGTRFRWYSLATMATSLVAGAFTTPYPARMEAGLPTPGFGVIERIDIYASLLWIAVLGVVLLRRPQAADR
jgi:hypothetical membrane protein